MLIETQLTANDNIMNFFVEQKLIIDGAAEFSDAKSIRQSVLAENLFDIGGIKSLLITADVISVTKKANAEWKELKPQILAEIIDFAARGEAVIVSSKKEENDVVAQIIGLIEARIRPIVQKDGGDIIFKTFEKGIVFVEMQGKCVGCPYAQRTLKDGVEKILKTYIKEVVAVEKCENL